MLGGRQAIVRGVLAGGLVMASLGACRAIADLKNLEYVPSAAPCSPPSLPAAGAGRVRLVNAGTSGTSDFCVRTSGTTDWGRPVLYGGGPSCASGLDYAQATFPFAVPVGAVDVEAVPAGSTCDPSAATSQLMGVPVGDATVGSGGAGSPVMTLLRFGSPANERLVALPEEPGSDSIPSNERLRVVNLLSSGESIELGLAAGASLPTTVAAPLWPQAFAPGAAAPGEPELVGQGNVDAQGYLVTETLGLYVGVVTPGQTNALVVVTTPSKADTQTLYTLGDSSDSLHRIRGLFCEDSRAPGTADAGPTGVIASCQLTPLPALTVDTFNASLYGAAAAFENDRRSAMFAAIAARPSDLMCIVEVDRDSDKEGVAATANGRFPYSFFPKTDLTTTPNDPSTADGGIPPTPTTAPCASFLAQAEDVVTCLASQCTATGDATGSIATASCLTYQCPRPLLTLIQSSPAGNACFGCLAYYASAEYPLGQALTACTQDAVQPFAFGGMTPSMILSRYPFAETPTVFQLPSTGWRRAVLYAPIQLEDQVVDFYCGQLSSPIISGELPYSGNYGVNGTLPDGGSSSVNGWEQEQDLQVARAIAFIQQTSGKSGRPAIVAGDWHSSRATSLTTPDAGTQTVLNDLAPEVTTALLGAFPRADPAGYVPSCGFCPAPTNVYNGSAPPADFTPTFLFGFAAGSTVAESFWGMDPAAVTLTPIPNEPCPTSACTGPIVEYFPRTVQILRPTAP